MKKGISVLLFTFLLLSVFCVYAFAGNGDTNSDGNTYSYSDLCDGLTDETVEMLKGLGIDELSFEDLFSVTPTKIFDLLFSLFGKSLKEPVKYFFYSLGIYMIFSLLNSFGADNKALSLISVSSSTLVLAVPVTRLVTESFSVINAVANYNTVISGVLCGLISASGGVVSGASYSVLTVFFFNVISKICEAVSKPVVNGLCFFSFMSCFNIFDVKAKITELIKKVYIWFLGICGTLFSGVLSLKTVLSSSADSVSVRSVKFLLGKSLPLVGGVVSDSCTAILASVIVLKNTVGVFGIISIVITVLPVILKMLSWLLSLSLLEITGEMLSFDEINKSVSVFKSAITLLLATVIFVSAVFIVCVGLMLMFSKNGA